MSTRLPTEALRTFVHAAELENFRAAALRLHLTAGAVSQRIASLESHLGCRLFERTPRGVKLSPDGLRLLEEVRKPVAAIEAALSRQSVRSALRVQTVSSFANLWLIPRLERFHALCPDIDVEIETSTKLIDLSARTSPVDVSIRYGQGTYPGLSAIELMRPQIVLVARFDKVSDGAQPDRALRRLKLLRERDLTEWSYWLKRYSIPKSEVTWGASLEDDAALIRAAMAGQGVASVRAHYVCDLVREGTLAVLAYRKQVRDAYHLVARPDRINSKPVAAFRRWLLAEISALQDGFAD